MGFHLFQRLLMVGPFLSQRRHLLRNAPIFRYMGCFSVFVLGGHGVVVSAGSPDLSVNFLPPAPPFTVRTSPGREPDQNSWFRLILPRTFCLRCGPPLEPTGLL